MHVRSRPQLRHPLLLKLVFSAQLEPARLDELLAHYRASLLQTLAEYQARAQAPEIFTLARPEREATIWKLSIDHGITWCNSEIGWLDRAREVLGSGPARDGHESKRRRPVGKVARTPRPRSST